MIHEEYIDRLHLSVSKIQTHSLYRDIIAPHDIPYCTTSSHGYYGNYAIMYNHFVMNPKSGGVISILSKDIVNNFYIVICRTVKR